MNYKKSYIYAAIRLIMLKKLLRNPYFIFLPFLFFYAYIIFINKWPTLYGDEIRYADFAWNLLHGYYSPPAPHINLWNGPGYPLTIVPFMALRVHSLYITLMNAVYLYLGVVFLFKAIKLVANHKVALIAGLLLAVYPNNLSILPILYTEAFTCMLVSGLVYSVVLAFARNRTKHIWVAGLLFGLLVLTKVMFGYVLLIGLAGCMGLALFKKNKVNYSKPVYMLLIGLAVTLPYLAYTYHLTGKALYWGNSGGMSLYWMSTPYDNEYGDWKNPELKNNQYPSLFKSAETVKLLRKNHQKEVDFILKQDEVKQDELFKQAAIKNIKADPLKFATNYYYNVSRMLFNFPYSYSYQDGAIVGNILRGSLILWASVIGIVCTALNWRRVISPVKFMIVFTAVYLILSGALSAYPRQLDVVLPVLLFWIGYLAANLPKLSLKFTEAESLENIELTDLEELNVLPQKLSS